MTWLQGKQYFPSFSIFPKLFNIKNGWVIRVFHKSMKNIQKNILEKKLDIDPKKVLIKEKNNNKLTVLSSNGFKIGDTVKLDIDSTPEMEFLLYYEIIDIRDSTLILNRPVSQKIDLTFLEKSNLSGIYYFDYIPEKAGIYRFEISNPKHLIKPFGMTIKVKEKFYIQELIETYTDGLNKKFNVKEYDPSEPISGVKDPIWFNKRNGKVWIWNGNKWITADE